MPGIKKAKNASKPGKRKQRDSLEVADAPNAGPSTSQALGSATKKLRRSITVASQNEEAPVDSSPQVSEDDDPDFEATNKKKPKATKPIKKKSARANQCPTCCQFLDGNNLRLYEGHPENAIEEEIALIDPRLSLFTGEENTDHDLDSRPSNKLTDFTVYDKDGHLCPFDTGLIESNKLLFISGYMKPVWDENGGIENGIPTMDIGPINEWWLSGYDGGESALIGISTGYADYYLMQPSQSYKPFMEEVCLKSFMTKTVVEFLVENHHENDSYEDLLNRLQTVVPPPGIPRLDEEALIRNAQFVCEQLLSLNKPGVEDDEDLVLQPSIRALIDLANVTFGKKKRIPREECKEVSKKLPKWSKATTTPLVQNVFEIMFTDHLDQNQTQGPRRKRCEICDACQHPDCSMCVSCRNMVKFGGPGTSKQACVMRRCPNMAVLEANDSDGENEDDANLLDKVQEPPPSPQKLMPRTFAWGKVATDLANHTIYEECHTVEANNRKVKMVIRPGDFVLLLPSGPNIPRILAQVKYLLEDKQKNKKVCHVQMFIRASQSVIGETACKNEILQLEECLNVEVFSIECKLEVHKVDIPENWAKLGGTKDDLNKSITFTDDKTFWYQKAYEKRCARFVNLPEDPANIALKEQSRYCGCCERKFVKSEKYGLQVLETLENRGPQKEVMYSGVKWQDQVYRSGSCVFLDTSAFYIQDKKPVLGRLASTNAKERFKDEDEMDEIRFPEYYRKNDTIRGSNENTPEPFRIARIISLYTRKPETLVNINNLYMKVAKFYRPENTERVGGTDHLDMNLLYWSEDECEVQFSLVEGKCWVRCADSLPKTPLEWSQLGPYRFYFNQAYDRQTNTFSDPTEQAMLFGITNNKIKGKGKGKGKGKAKEKDETEEGKEAEKKEDNDVPPDWPAISRPLRCLDVFAGCGGLSEGMHQSGVAESKWAIEKEEAAANAFKINNPKCSVFTEDCNALLKLIMEAGDRNVNGQKVPEKGDVELMCGGPPCQGFSGMNRFNSRQYSIFKNSLVVSYLSYCDYYRPKFFVLENVRNFVAFKQSMVLKLALRCLLAMGYQCTFGVLQAGNYGIPQTRRRAIILAAAPSEILPKFPEPLTVFNPRNCLLDVVVNKKKFSSGCRWRNSAPLRTVIVRDVMSDLPSILNGANQEEMAYGSEPLSYIQKLLRKDCSVLRDHICKEMSALVEARMSHIPLQPGSDWRDLPNIVVRLADGRTTNKLMYTHHDKVTGRSPKGELRGVCSCAEGKACDMAYRQDNTLIPWCLPHTANKYNNWGGLYGRVNLDGFFSTTITNPEPMAKQGRVLHPEQTRVVSVRECARSQGFPDKYRFYGTILEKHRQIGNAVPPPMSAAIGQEIRVCVNQVEQMQSKVQDSETIEK